MPTGRFTPVKAVQVCLSLILLIATTFTQPAYGQAGSVAKLTGQALDASGAVMPGVAIEVEDLGTGRRYTSTTNAEGFYYLEQLPPGDYKLVAKSTGFAEAAISPIHLDVRQVASLNVTMRPGDVVQTVEVSASALRLNTQTSDVSPLVPTKLLTQLPTSFRNPVELVGLLPGVTQVRTRGGSANDPFNATATWGRSNFTVGGGFKNTSAFLVDGVDAGHSYSAGGMGMNVIINPDTISEFKVHILNYSAEFGNGNGAMNLITKSGTNTVHGRVSYFHQNGAFNANDFFNNARGAKRPFLIRHQYDFALLGPVYIPKLYDGRNRTFFAVDWGEMRQPNTTTFLARVPTQAELAGDFSNVYSTSGQPITIYNPLDTFTDVDGRVKRRPFPNNVIPSSLLVPFARNVAQYYPRPNRLGGDLGAGGLPTQQNNFYNTPPNNFILQQFNIKVDHNIGSNHRLTGRISQNPQPITCLPVERTTYGTVASPDRCFSQSPSYSTLSHTWTVSPKLLVNWSLYNLTSPFYSYTPGDDFNLTSLGGPFTDPKIVNYITSHYSKTRFPNISVAGYGSTGGGGDGGGIQDTPIGWQTAVTKFLGNHSVKAGFGGYLRRILTSGTTSYNSNGGSFAFNGSFTAGPDPLLPTVNTGNGFADMQLGLLSGGSVSAPSIQRKLFSTYYSWYVQDDWRVTPKLTLNLGLRYDFELSSREPNNYIAVFDAQLPNPIGNQVGPNTNGKTLNDFFGRPLLGGWVFAGSKEANGSIRPAQTDFSQWAPRLGAAYRLNNSVVLRGGFGKIYWPSTAGAHDNGQCPSCTASNPIVGTVNGIDPAVSITNPFPGGLAEPRGNVDGALTRIGQTMDGGGSRYPHTPYLWQWNFNIEVALPSNTLFSIAYSGNRGRNLPCPTGNCGDQVSMGTINRVGPAILDSVPNPFYGIITDSTSPLSRPTVQAAQLYKSWPQYVGGSYRFPQANSSRDFPGFSQEYPFKSSWEAMLVSFEKRYSTGLQFTLAYTLSKTITNSDGFVGWLGPVAGYQDLYNMSGEKSLAAEDSTHRLVIGHVYDLPFGHGKQFGSSIPSIVNGFLGNWQFSGIFTLQSGVPLPITATPNNSGKQYGTLRPNLVGTPQTTQGTRGERIYQWVDPSTFALPPPFTIGNAPRTLNVRGDKIQEYDVTMSKYFPIKERARVEFRAEAFNLFNRPQLNTPNMAFGSPTFGRVTSTILPARFLQLGLRVLW